MLRSWWWEWSLLNSFGPMAWDRLTESPVSKIVPSSLLEKDGRMTRTTARNGGRRRHEWITKTMSYCSSSSPHNVATRKPGQQEQQMGYLWV